MIDRTQGPIRACAIVVLCLAWIAAVQAAEEDFTGTVTRVFDGDSFLVRPAAGGKDIDVRLMDIDAPEKDQPHGAQARAALLRLVGSRQVFVDVIEVDKYERKIARVYRQPDRLDLARALVHDGHAWVYRRKLRDHSLVVVEEQARDKKLGLWALPAEQRKPPWTHRYERKREAGRPRAGRPRAREEADGSRATRVMVQGLHSQHCLHILKQHASGPV